MSNSRVETRVGTPLGELSFEEYFVQRWYQDPVESIRFAGAADAEPGPGVLEAIMNADIELLAPSNPVTSIGPILAVPGVREALHKTKARIAAVSPIVAGEAVAGPAGILMASQGLAVSVAGVAEAYHDFLDMLVIDTRDAQSVEELKESVCACTLPKPSCAHRKTRPTWPQPFWPRCAARVQQSRGPSTYDPDPGQEFERRRSG
jgi:LPPG:FO 2-phospho-L-lactate transferase